MSILAAAFAAAIVVAGNVPAAATAAFLRSPALSLPESAAPVALPASPPASVAPVTPPVPAGPVPRQALCLLASYPEVLCRFEENALVACDGQRFVWDDGRPKSLWEKFIEPDLEDVFVYPYPAEGDWPPAPQDDPGVIRHEGLLQRLYGATAANVTKRLVGVRWFGRTVRISPEAAGPLRRVAAELAKLPRSMRRYFATTGGTFNWRYIKGTDLRSLHSYGIAIDVGVAHSDYWKWVSRATDGDEPPAYRNRFPQKVVEAFERHGFLWGGRWRWFDTMHFEYRPELLCARKAAPPSTGPAMIEGPPAGSPPSAPAMIEGPPAGRPTAIPPSAPP